MAGEVIAVIPARVLDFSNIASVGGAFELTLKQNIDVTEWLTACLMLRVTDRNLAGGTLTFNLYSEGFTEDDPGQAFLMFIGNIVIDNTVSAPYFQIIWFSQANFHPFGSALRVTVRADRVAPAPELIQATCAVDICLKNEDAP